ncbi:MAG: hypothetical protein GKR90_19275 [Pseudomonadales bacterium]|nr:hypothetical protein [Pseudomonadales bacterium]
MEGIGLGAGLAAFGLWIFIGMAVLGGIWDSIRKRETQHETLRRMFESGQAVDPALFEQLTGGNKDVARDLRIGGYICLAIAPGLVLLGWFMSALATELLTLLTGVAALLVCISAGMLYAARSVKQD